MGLAIAISLALVACESDSTVATQQDPDDDQALALSVLGAKGDTLAAAVENEVVVDTSLPPDLRPVAPAPAPPAATPPALRPAVVQAQPVVPIARPSARPAQPNPVTRVAPDPTRKPVEPASATPPRAREESDRETPAATGMIPKGIALSVVTTRAACNEDASVGNTIRGELNSSVRGSNGAVIPRGAQVVAQVTSVDKWGAGVGVQVTSIRFGGRSYPVRSRVEYLLPEGTDRGACIPGRTRLDVETKDLIRIRSGQ